MFYYGFSRVRIDSLITFLAPLIIIVSLFP